MADLYNDFFKKGFDEGMAQGIAETRVRNIKTLMANLGCSLEKALELLGIPQSEKENLLPLLG